MLFYGVQFLLMDFYFPIYLLLEIIFFNSHFLYYIYLIIQILRIKLKIRIIHQIWYAFNQFFLPIFNIVDPYAFELFQFLNSHL